MITRQQVLFHMLYDMRSRDMLVARDHSAMAMCSPGKPVWLWLREDGNAEQMRSFFCDYLRTRNEPLTGLVAEQETALICAEIYAQKTGVVYSLREIIAYYATEINDGRDADRLCSVASKAGRGRLRPAGLGDADFLPKWLAAFYAEALQASFPLDDTADGGYRIRPNKGLSEQGRSAVSKEGCLYIWEDGRPVAMGMLCARNAATRRINLVYTSKEHRRCGYGRSITVALAQLALAGDEIPVLYTAAENKAANNLYMSLGFQEAGRLTEVVFKLDIKTAWNLSC